MKKRSIQILGANGKVIHTDGFEFVVFLERLVVTLLQLDLGFTGIALKSGLCYPTVLRIMRRESKDIRLTTLGKIANTFNVSTDYLMGKCPAITADEEAIEKEVIKNLKTLRTEQDIDNELDAHKARVMAKAELQNYASFKPAVATKEVETYNKLTDVVSELQKLFADNPTLKEMLANGQ